MADTKISALSAASALDGTEPFPVVQSSTTKKATGAQMSTYVGTQLISDTAYDATSWNAVTGVAPSKNAVRDQIEAMVALQASDTAYASTWNGVTTIPPSKNAVYDKFESRLPTPVSGSWVVARPDVHQLNNGAALAADTIYYSAVWIWNYRTISDLGFRLHATTSANNVKLAIYANNASTNKPTGSPLAVTGNISMGSTGNLSADITGADVTLAPGLYWFAIWAEGTTGSISASGASDGISLAIGDTTLANLSSGDGQNWGFTYTSAESFAGGTFPDAAGETLTLVARTTAARTYQFYMKVV